MKKNVCLLMAIASIIAIMVFPANAAYYPYPQNWGFDIDSEIYGSYGYIQELVQLVYVNSGSTLIGSTSTTVFFTSQRARPAQNRVVNVALFYTIMTPFEYYSNGVRLLGTSDLLTVSATLPNSNQNVISNSPKNNPDTSVYTVGVESGNGENGLSAGLSASTTITKSNLTITNKSNHYLKKHSIEYDYEHLLFSNNNYIKYESEQRSVFCYETDGNPFTFPVSVSVRFGNVIPGFLSNLDFIDNVANKTTTWNIGIN